jgi:hypothetical protein
MNPQLPLNEPQERRLTTILADLERALRDLRSSIADTPENLLLTEYQNPLDPALAGPLGERLSRAQGELGQMARALDLPRSCDSILRTHLARLRLLSIDLYATLPSSGLRGYGEVAVATAQHLEERIPKLGALEDEMVRLLTRGPR